MGKLIRAVLRGLGGSNASRLLDEPKWVHARKAVVEPNGLLTAKELAERICAHFGCSYEPPLAIVEEVA